MVAPSSPKNRQSHCPMPPEAPVMAMVLPANVLLMVSSGSQWWWWLPRRNASSNGRRLTSISRPSR